MNKTKIDWADYSWNPVTGCFNKCKYCYARRIANRFGSIDNNTPIEDIMNGLHISLDYEHGKDYIVYDECVELITPVYILESKTPYPFNFRPTFHRYRLNEPAKLKKPANIFVTSMGDLFGDWVPDEWIQEVFKACEAAPWHRYLFLTKNPARYIELFENQMLNPHSNFWYGTTITKATDPYLCANFAPCNLFLSIEPILEDFGEGGFHPCVKWIIVGAETGNSKGKVIPRREWIENIVNRCRAANVPVFMKNSLAGIWCEPLIQEFPWERAK